MFKSYKRKNPLYKTISDRK